MTMKVKAIEKKLKFTKDPNDGDQGGCPAQRRESGCDAGLLGCSWRGDQGMGNGGPLGSAARTGNHAIRPALEV